MADTGIVYVATKQDRYLEEAFLSADSVKRLFPDLPITLFTDLADHPLCSLTRFDRVEKIEGASGFSSAWAEGLLNRSRCLTRTPYARTLHLDTDTRVFTSELLTLFDELAAFDVAMVETARDDSYSRDRYGMPMFNVGVIAYRRTDQVWKWLERWSEISARNFRLAGETPLPRVASLDHVADEKVRRRLLTNDQISMVELMSPEGNQFGLKVKVLDHSWNHRGSRLPENNLSAVRILHTPALKARTHADILAIAFDAARTGRSDEAEALYDYVASRSLPAAPPSASRSWIPWRRGAQSGGEPEHWSNPAARRADLHIRQRQFQHAYELCAPALAEDPGNPYLLAALGEVAAQVGRPAEGVDLLEQALAIRPKSRRLHRIYGQALTAAGRLPEAAAALREAQGDGEAETAFLLGQTLLELKDYGGAATAYRQVLSIDKTHGPANNNLLPALLGDRQYEEALAHADGVVSRAGWHARALAFKSVALTELGHSDDARSLVDLDRLLVAEELIAPPGYPSLAQFNRALGKALARQPSLERDPRQHTTKFGLHSGNLNFSTDHEIALLNAAIAAAVAKRIQSVPAGSAHPFEAHAPTNYRMNSWTVIMDKGGHQTAHIHGEAWLSGVYYVEVPDEVPAEDNAEHAGWIRFGRSEERWYRPGTEPVTRLIRPRPGLLLTFPSYFWHDTLPLHVGKRRISYAFDIIPM